MALQARYAGPHSIATRLIGTRTIFVVAAPGGGSDHVWDMTDVPSPPTLSSPIHYGGSGTAYPPGGLTIQADGADVLLERPADGQPLVNYHLEVSRPGNMIVRGLQIDIDRTFGRGPPVDVAATTAVIDGLANASMASASTLGYGWVAGAYNDAWRLNPYLRAPAGYSTNYTDFADQEEVIQLTIDADCKTLYFEGLYINSPLGEGSGCDGIQVANHTGTNPVNSNLIFVNCRVGTFGIVGDGDRDLTVDGQDILRTIHCDALQLTTPKLYRLEFHNTAFASAYQGAFMPDDQNEGVQYTLVLNRACFTSPTGEGRATCLWLSDDTSDYPVFARVNDLYVERDHPDLPGASIVNAYNAGGHLLVYPGALHDAPDTLPVPPVDYSWDVSYSAGNGLMKYRAPGAASDAICPASAVGVNYVSPW